MNDRNLDAWITGENDPNAPFNQPDPEQQIETISDAINENEPVRALEILGEVLQEINMLRWYAAQNENTFLMKKLTNIYNQL